MLKPDLIWLMIVGMGVYQGVNPPVGWLLAVGRGLQSRSLREVFSGTWALAFGHFLSMIVLLIPLAAVAAVLAVEQVSMATLMEVAWVCNFVLVGFGLYKIIRPQHPRFIARIRPNQQVYWSFWMGLAHCGTPLMMVPIFINLVALSAWFDKGAPLIISVVDAMTLALIVCLGMTAPLLFTASGVAAAVFEKLGLRALTRYWINLDLGWALMFILMGVMGLAM